MQPIAHRYDLELLFDVVDGNPNGDPDADNLPRTDPVTGHGLVTDVAIKRRVRNLVGELRAGEPGYQQFIQTGAVLNAAIEHGYDRGQELREALSGELPQPLSADALARRAHLACAPERAGGGLVPPEAAARAWLCANYFDVRTFGAVLSTGDSDAAAADGEDEEAAKGKKGPARSRSARKVAGRVTGPVQFTLARSIDPIQVQSHRITRQAVTNARDAHKERTMGVKHTVPYALYRLQGFVGAPYARRTGFCQNDLDVLLEALQQLFALDLSAGRGLMTVRRLVVWRHDSVLGNAQAHRLFDRLRVERRTEVPRSFADYQIDLDDRELPGGVHLHLDCQP